MGTRGINTTTKGKRIFALAFLCVAIPALLTDGGLLCARQDPPPPGAPAPISLQQKTITNEKGEIAGISVTGTVDVPPEVRRQKVHISIYYNDFIDSIGMPIAVDGRYIKIAADGSFKWDYTFPSDLIVNNGYWGIKAVIGSPASGVLAAGEIKQFLVGNETVRDEQKATERQWLLRWAGIFKEMRQRAIAYHDQLRAAGCIDAKFRDGGTEEEDFERLRNTGLKPAAVPQLIAPRQELSPAISEFLRYVHSEDGHKVLAAAGAAMKIQTMDFSNAQADLSRVSIAIHPPADTPVFPAFAPSVDPRANVRISTSEPLKPLLEELGKAYKAVYPASSVNVNVADGAGLVNAMQTNKTDLIILSRPLIAAERAAIADKRGLEPVAIKVDSLGSLAVFVNSANPVKGLSVEEIHAIFSVARNAGHAEDITTWGQVGVLDPALKDEPIKLVSPAADKPESALFRDYVMLGGNMKPGAVFAPDAASVIAAVKGDQAVIGFCRIEDLTADVRAVPVSARQWGAFIDAVPDNITAGVYPLTCYIYAYLIYDVSWGIWRPELSQEMVGREDEIRKKCPKMVVDTTDQTKRHLDEMKAQVENVTEHLRYDLMGKNRVTELWIAQEVMALMASRGMTAEEARGVVLQKNGGLEEMRRRVKDNLPKAVAKAHQGFNDAMNSILVKLEFTRNVTVANLYSDVTKLYSYYRELCGAYQAGLKEFAPPPGAPWAATWLDSETAFKDQAAKYVPNDESARNIGRNRPEIKGKMEACVDELQKLRWAFLKDLHTKNRLAPPANVPPDVKTINEHAREFKINYEALSQIVQAERQIYLPPLMQSLTLLQGKFQALNDYMTPFMPDTPGRVAPNGADVKKWLDEWSPDVLKEQEASSARLADPNFTDVFLEAARTINNVLIPQILSLREEYFKAVTQNDAASAKRAAMLKSAISKGLDQVRTLIEGRFDIESKQIYTPGEAAYSEHFAPPPAP